MTYREQEFVERCHCDAPAVARCAMCNRPRCAAHLERGTLCHRCREAIGHELRGRSHQPWLVGGAVFVGGGFGGLVLAHSAAGGPIGLAAGIALGFASRVVIRRAIMRELAPRLASTVGEVEPPRDRGDEQFPRPGGSGVGYRR